MKKIVRLCFCSYTIQPCFKIETAQCIPYFYRVLVVVSPYLSLNAEVFLCQVFISKLYMIFLLAPIINLWQIKCPIFSWNTNDTNTIISVIQRIRWYRRWLETLFLPDYFCVCWIYSAKDCVSKFSFLAGQLHSVAGQLQCYGVSLPFCEDVHQCVKILPCLWKRPPVWSVLC